MDQKNIQIDLSDILKKYGNFGTSLILAFIIMFLLSLVYTTFFTYIKPDEYGIKQMNVGLFGPKGIQEKIYHAGLNFYIPFGIERFYKFPKTIQILEFSLYNKKANNFEAVKIQTSDGFYVDVDVTILYKIEDPYKTITTIGPGKQFLFNGIVPKAVPVLKASLGKLTVEEFYNSELRVKYMEEAERKLDEELNDKGLSIVKVLIRYFSYSKEIQQNIEDKKLKDQLVEKNMAESKSAKAQADLKKTIQEGMANVDVQLSQGKAYVTKKLAEIDLYKRKQHAEADLLVEQAKAKALELKNNALKGMGSDILVALEMANVFSGIQNIILPSTGKVGLNPLDLNRLLEFSGVNLKKHDESVAK